MNLIDTHAHLYWDSFKQDFDEMIQRALEAGVSTIINVGVDVEKSQVALDQVKNTNWPQSLSVYSTIGIHPHEAISYSQKDLVKDIAKLEQIYNSDPQKVVAVGECGLDFYFEGNPGYIGSLVSIDEQKNLQRRLFKAQINLAKKLNLPLIVHCRDDRSRNLNNTEAWDEILQMVDNHPTILHCYSGLLHTTNYILQATNLIVSFAGSITYPKNEYLREAAKMLPLEKIILETDCPFLPPQSKRGQRNEPAYIKETAQTIADLKSLSLEEIAEQTTKTGLGIFHI